MKRSIECSSRLDDFSSKSPFCLFSSVSPLSPSPTQPRICFSFSSVRTCPLSRFIEILFALARQKANPFQGGLPSPTTRFFVHLTLSFFLSSHINTHTNIFANYIYIYKRETNSIPLLIPNLLTQDGVSQGPRNSRQDGSRSSRQILFLKIGLPLSVPAILELCTLYTLQTSSTFLDVLCPFNTIRTRIYIYIATRPVSLLPLWTNISLSSFLLPHPSSLDSYFPLSFNSHPPLFSLGFLFSFSLHPMYISVELFDLFESTPPSKYLPRRRERVHGRKLKRYNSTWSASVSGKLVMSQKNCSRCSLADSLFFNVVCTQHLRNCSRFHGSFFKG